LFVFFLFSAYIAGFFNPLLSEDAQSSVSAFYRQANEVLQVSHLLPKKKTYLCSGVKTQQTQSPLGKFLLKKILRLVEFTVARRLATQIPATDSACPMEVVASVCTLAFTIPTSPKFLQTA